MIWQQQQQHAIFSFPVATEAFVIPGLHVNTEAIYEDKVCS